jgi:hypothetical protein
MIEGIVRLHLLEKLLRDKRKGRIHYSMSPAFYIGEGFS